MKGGEEKERPIPDGKIIIGPLPGRDKPKGQKGFDNPVLFVRHFGETWNKKHIAELMKVLKGK